MHLGEENRPAPAAADFALPAGIVPKELHVLHVEDNPDDKFFIEWAWQKTELPVKRRFADSAAGAIAYLADLVQLAQTEKVHWPDLAVLDVFLPALTGLSVVKYIRATLTIQNLPVVIFTGNPNDLLAQEAYDAGANSVLVKPCALKKTVALLSELYRFWSTVQLPIHGHQKESGGASILD